MVYTSTKGGTRPLSMTNKSNLGVRSRRNTSRMPEGVPEAEERLERTGNDFSTLSESNVRRFNPRRDDFSTPQKLPSIKSTRM